MKRLLRVTLILALLVAGLWFGAPRFAAWWVGSSGTDLAGLPFSVGDLSVNPFSGRATISDARLLSEAPFSAPFVAKVGTISARFEPKSLRGPFVDIREVVIDGPEIIVEQQGTLLNVRELAQRVAAYAANADTTSAIRVYIHELRITSARGTLISDIGQREFGIEDLTLRGIGSDSLGTPIPLVVAQLIEPVMRRTLESAGLPTGDGIMGGLRRLLKR